jgi:hypothetical protein
MEMIEEGDLIARDMLIGVVVRTSQSFNGRYVVTVQLLQDSNELHPYGPTYIGGGLYSFFSDSVNILIKRFDIIERGLALDRTKACWTHHI